MRSWAAALRRQGCVARRRFWSDAARKARALPPSIARPSYAYTGMVAPAPLYAKVNGPEDIAALRTAGRLARRMLDLTLSLAKPGVSTLEIDDLVHDAIVQEGAYPAPLNYSGFPKSICASIGRQVCHGIPDSYVLQKGDIASFDISLFLGGVFGDNCGTIIVGDDGGDPGARRLVDATQEALDAAIAGIRPGACLTSVGEAVSAVAEREGFGVIAQYCGHGINTTFHAPPLVQHVRNDQKFELKAGHVFTIEPMIVENSPEVQVCDDKWTVITVDKGRAAQFEHMILVTPDGHEVLTLPE